MDESTVPRKALARELGVGVTTLYDWRHERTRQPFGLQVLERILPLALMPAEREARARVDAPKRAERRKRERWARELARRKRERSALARGVRAPGEWW